MSATAGELRLSTADLIVRGTTAHVFRSPRAGRLLKLYLQQTDPRGSPQTLFLLERLAYEALERSPQLTQYAPAFYGEVRIADVTDSDGSSCASRYRLDLCLELEWLRGEEFKPGALPERFRGEAERLLDLFFDAGIVAGDASIFVDGDSLRIADFALAWI